MSITPATIRKLLTGQLKLNDIPEHETPQHRNTDRQQQIERLTLYSWLGAGATVLLLLAIVIGFQIAERGQIRSGVQALGVDLGGMSRDEARVALTEASRERMSQPVMIADGDKTWQISAADAGLTIDVDGMVDDAFHTGRDGVSASRLAVLWHVRSGTTTVGASRIAVHGDMLNTELQGLAGEIHQDKVEPVLSVSPQGVDWVAPVVGRSLDVNASRSAVLNALADGDDEVDLVVQEDQPTAPLSAFQDAKTRLDHIWDGPIKIVSGDETWNMTPDIISLHLSVDPPRDGQPAKLNIDQDWVSEVVWEFTVSTNSLPRSPRVWWGDGGKLTKVQDGQPGYTLDGDKAGAIVMGALSGETDANEYNLPVTKTDPPALPADLAAVDVSTVLASSTTPYGEGIIERRQNIELAASRLTGTLVMPGQTFSFNSEVGPTTLEAGFQMGYGISTDENGATTTVPAEAGGICQVATTVFQPVFWAGYEIDQRGTHSYWIPRYAYNGYAGLDAAVESTVGLDMKWTNNGPTPVMLEVATNGSDLTVNLYGAPTPWRVEVDAPVITNTVKADDKIYYQATDTLPDGQTRSVEHAQDGFDASVTRRVIQGDNVTSTDFTTTYEPAKNMVLVGSSTGELPAEYQQ
jgi:vancomycin resistance protein YoaR